MRLTLTHYESNRYFSHADFTCPLRGWEWVTEMVGHEFSCDPDFVHCIEPDEDDEVRGDIITAAGKRVARVQMGVRNAADDVVTFC